MKKLSPLYRLFILVPLLFIGCSDDPEIDPGPAPEIPPISTFLMDFNIVEADGGRIDSKNNWAYSALNVGIWNTIITITFAVPVASFAESFNHDPVYNASLQGWTWEYSYVFAGANYNARLQAVIKDAAVEWEMFISQAGVYDNFNWYSGVSSLDGLSGEWTLNRNPTDPEPFLGIEWSRSESNDKAQIGYTNVDPDSEGNGGFIYFSRDDNADFDRDYNIFNKVEDNLTEIEWSSSNQDGRVRDFLHFGDLDYRCWDEQLDDIVCPE